MNLEDLEQIVKLEALKCLENIRKAKKEITE
jgi:hypothetical protein